MDAPEKLEPHEVDQQYVFDRVVDFIHSQGDDSMRRIVQTNEPDSGHWPIRLQLDVILKMLLNGLGSIQEKTIDLEERLAKLEKKNVST
jgi:hypothetical protein|tara:strand:+ start:896 stop:1162 length:267 start_codon:yes stop_codon:yes gene_type:complete